MVFRRLRPESGAGSLTRATTGGAMWMGGSLAMQTGIGLVAQIVLASILLPRDFGLFALVVSVSYVLHSLGNFGMKTLLSQRTAGEIEEMRPSIYPVGLAAAAISGLLLVAISPLAASVLDEPELQLLLVVTAATFLLKPHVATSMAAMQARLQFSRVAWAMLAGSVAHYTIAIILAVNGSGAMSLVVGTQANVATLSVVLWAMSGIAPWNLGDRSLKTRSMRQAAVEARWPVAGEVAMDATGRIDFLMLGLFVPTPVVGLYYFAFQLIVRLHELLTGVTRNVLFPALAQIPDHPDRQGVGVFRAGTLLVVTGGVLAAGLIATMSSIEEILWGGRWAAAVPAMLLLATVAPGQAAQSAVEQLLKARARFRRWTAVIALRTLGGALVALGVGWSLGEAATARDIAVAIAVFLAAESIVEVLLVSRWVGVSGVRYWRTMLPIWASLVTVGWLVESFVSSQAWGAWRTGLVGGLLVLAYGGALVAGLWRWGVLAPSVQPGSEPSSSS